MKIIVKPFIWGFSMNKFKIKIILFTILFLIVKNYYSVGEEKKIKIGFCQIGDESEWRKAQTQSIIAEAEKRGNIELMIEYSISKFENQLKVVKKFIEDNVDFIVIAPMIDYAWDDILKKAKVSNIPVIFLEQKIRVSDESLYLSYIVSDFVKQAETVAKWLVKRLNYKGNIVELEGVERSWPAVYRKKGFTDIINQYPDLNIIRSMYADFYKDKAKEVMSKILAEEKKIDAVYAQCDNMALGAIEAIEEYGLKPGEDIIVVSIDGLKSALQAIVDGKLACTVEYGADFGPILFETIDKVLAGEKVPRRIIKPEKLFTKENAEEGMNNRKY